MPEVQVQFIEGLRRGGRRAGAFLVGFPKLDAKGALDAKNQLIQDQYKSRIEHWLGRSGSRWVKRYYHGWTKKQFGGDYITCFVFKYASYRLYGFVAHPPKFDERFELFVGLEFHEKWQQKTEERILKRIVKLQKDPAVIVALEEFGKVHGGRS